MNDDIHLWTNTGTGERSDGIHISATLAPPRIIDKTAANAKRQLMRTFKMKFELMTSN